MLAATAAHPPPALTSAVQDALHGPKAFSGGGHVQHAQLEILQHRLGSVKAVVHGGDDHARGSSLHPPAAVQTCPGTQSSQARSSTWLWTLLAASPCPVPGRHIKLRAVEESTPAVGTERGPSTVRSQEFVYLQTSTKQLYGLY